MNTDATSLFCKVAFLLSLLMGAAVVQQAHAGPPTPATLIAQFHFEDAPQYLGQAGEVIDTGGYSGGPYNGAAVGSSTLAMQVTGAALQGDPGTCSNANFSGTAAIDIPGLPVVTTAGQATSVSFWMYWTGSNGVMPIGWGTYDLWTWNGYFGFNTGNSDSYGTPSSDLVNGWHHVAAVFYNGSVSGNQLYIDGMPRPLTQVGTPSLGSAVVQSTLRLGGWTASTGYRFTGRLDEVKVFNGALTAAQVSGLSSETHPCGPMAEWRLDEILWKGTAGEVANYSQSTSGGTAKFNASYGSALPATKAGGKVCGQGDFSGSSDFVDVGIPEVDNLAGNLTVMGWINLNDLSNYQYLYSNARDCCSLTHGVQLAGRYGGSTPQFDLWFSDGTHATVTGGSSLATAAWSHLVGTWDGTTMRLYVNGTLVASDASYAGKSYSGSSTYTGTLGAMGYSQGAFNANASLDEVKIWNRALTAAEIASVYGNENAGKRWNGSTPVCAAPAALIAQYHFEESMAWNGTAGEVKDSAGSSGGPYNASLVGSPLPSQLVTNPALSGSTGTCAYAKLPGPISNGGRIEVNNLPVSTKAADQASVAFWMYWDGSSNIFPMGWKTYELWLANGYLGFNTSSSDLYGVNISTLANGWHHVVAVFFNGNVTNNLLYLDGVLQSPQQIYGTPNLNNAYLYSTLGFGGYSSGTYYRFSGFIDEAQIYSGTLYPAQVKAIYNQTHPCMPINVPGYLNAFDTSVAQGSINGPIKTKVAGPAYALSVVALNGARTAVDTSYNQTVKVELLGNVNAGVALDVNNCPLSATLLQTTTVAIVAGRSTVNLNGEPNVWRDVRVRISYPAAGTPSLVACSADNFAIRPSSHTVLAQDANWQAAGNSRVLNGSTSGASTVHKAGQPFSLTVSAYNSLGALASNYDGTPTVASATCILPSTGCVGGTLSTGTFSGSGGTVSSATATYSEAGAINLQLQDTSFASVDANDGSLPADLTSYSNVISVGRFVPDHFVVVPGTVSPGCVIPGKTAYTYLGQDGLLTRQTLYAQNAQGVTTQNYAGLLAKLDLASYASYGFSALGMPLGSTLGSGANAPTGTWVAGVATDTLAAHVVSKPSAPAIPASLTILGTPLDPDGVTVPAAVTLASNQLYRHGRLKLGNTYGSPSTDIVIPVAAQFWNGTDYVQNPDDECSSFNSNAIGFKNYTSDLTASELGASHWVGTRWTLSKGALSLRLARPSNGDGKFRGSTDVFFNLAADAACTTLSTSSLAMAYLQDTWSWMGASCLNPTARVTLGLEKQKFLFRREVH